MVQLLPVYSLNNLPVNVKCYWAAEHQLQCRNSSHTPSFESYAKLRVMFQPLALLPSNAQTYKCSVIVNEFCHELSALCSPTALFPTDSRIRRLLRFSTHPNTQEPRDCE